MKLLQRLEEEVVVWVRRSAEKLFFEASPNVGPRPRSLFGLRSGPIFCADRILAVDY